MRSLALVLALSLRLAAQDAGMALGQSVSVRTMRNTSKLPAQQIAEIDGIIAAAAKAGVAHDYADAVKNYQHAMALLRGEAWTPARAWSAALTMKADHAIVQPGQTITVQVAQLFALDEPLAQEPSAVVNLVPFLNGQPGTMLKKIDHVNSDLSAHPLSFTVTIPDVENGGYRIAIDFGDTVKKNAPVAVQRGVMESLSKARARIARLDATKPVELPSAEMHLVRIEAADRGEFGDRIASMDFAGELREANRLLDDLETGKDPFANQSGDLRKAYRSNVDNTVQPYRLYVPSSYDGKAAFPLVLLLHGMGGDENSMFDLYGSGAFKKLAEKRGYLVACPKGRQPTSMYRGAAEQDVLDVLADVRRAYKVDASRIYMSGHSMGGYGTWSIAIDHPELFAALAPISGGGDASQVAKIAKIPQVVIHGDADATVSVTQSRTMVEADRKAGAEVKYMEIPGGSHTSVAVPAFEPIFDWFDAHHKQKYF